APAIRLHGVILRHPPPSGCELWLNSPDLDAFSLFPPTSRHYLAINQTSIFDLASSIVVNI
ncbi:MAG: hypothetical protein ACLQBA_10845, partial [Candidatus Binataceae bacterium]